MQIPFNPADILDEALRTAATTLGMGETFDPVVRPARDEPRREAELSARRDEKLGRVAARPAAKVDCFVRALRSFLVATLGREADGTADPIQDLPAL